MKSILVIIFFLLFPFFGKPVDFIANPSLTKTLAKTSVSQNQTDAPLKMEVISGDWENRLFESEEEEDEEEKKKWLVVTIITSFFDINWSEYKSDHRNEGFHLKPQKQIPKYIIFEVYRL